MCGIYFNTPNEPTTHRLQFWPIESQILKIYRNLKGKHRTQYYWINGFEHYVIWPEQLQTIQQQFQFGDLVLWFLQLNNLLLFITIIFMELSPFTEISNAQRIAMRFNTLRFTHLCHIIVSFLESSKMFVYGIIILLCTCF